MVTETAFDDLLVTSLKRKSTDDVGESASVYLERMSKAEILALMGGAPLDELEKEADEISQVAPDLSGVRSYRRTEPGG
jgi:hypothetical protein